MAKTEGGGNRDKPAPAKRTGTAAKRSTKAAPGRGKRAPAKRAGTAAKRSTKAAPGRGKVATQPKRASTRGQDPTGRVLAELQGVFGKGYRLDY